MIEYNNKLYDIADWVKKSKDIPDTNWTLESETEKAIQIKFKVLKGDRMEWIAKSTLEEKVNLMGQARLI